MILIRLENEKRQAGSGRDHLEQIVGNRSLKKPIVMKSVRITAIILLIVNGIGALGGGIGLIGDPSGESMGWTTEMLVHSPFKNFFIPGIVLFAANGILSLTVAFITITRKKHYALYLILQGAVLVGWIVVQVLMIRLFYLLHLIFLVVGMLLIACGYILYSTSPVGHEYFK